MPGLLSDLVICPQPHLPGASAVTSDSACGGFFLQSCLEGGRGVGELLTF